MEGLLEKVIAIAQNAGKLMLTEKDVDIGLKDTKENYVTSTDLKIQKLLRKELLEVLPGSKFMGEEEDIPSAGDEKYSPEDLVWVVDPIDGTANYAHGIPMSVVAIGLVQNGEPILGVVNQPYLWETFYAEKGKGAYLNGKPIHVSDNTIEHSLLCTAWSCYNKKRAPLCFDVTNRLYETCEDIRRIGTAAYELCLLAKGACDIYFEINLAPWDYTAAACILHEAGGFTASQYGELSYYGPCMTVAANSRTSLDQILGIIREMVEKHPEAEITFK
ncbi:MAG: inositol monophosphatase [archaeon]|nr:inositol monophosphatase [archaeon]